MRLTFVNFIIRKRPHGYKYRGKYRVVKDVDLPVLKARYYDYSQQEQNMLILRHPYLTVEQSRGHMSELRQHPLTKWNQLKEEKFSKKYTWAEQLSHLRVKDAWE